MTNHATESLIRLTTCMTALLLSFSTASSQVFYVPGPRIDNPNGTMSPDFFGASVAGLGDINGDGIPDFAIGADRASSNTGRIRVYSGLDLSIIYAIPGAASNNFFGDSSSAAGDVNDDGVTDLIVGAIGDGAGTPASGTARVFCGSSGIELYSIQASSGDRFGFSVSGVGDINGDGIADFAAGADEGASSGFARIYAGFSSTCNTVITPSVLFTIFGDSNGDRFGSSIAGIGDINNDGHDDILIGAPGPSSISDRPGYARIVSGADQSTIATFYGIGDGDNFGYTVSLLGDVNNDGKPDFAVGTRSTQYGYAKVYCGHTLSEIYHFDGEQSNDRFGRVIISTGDINGDGHSDIAITARNHSSNGLTGNGRVYVYSGADGSLLITLDGDASNDGFGRSATAIGDVNSDGIPDILIGARDGEYARVFISSVSPCNPADVNTAAASNPDNLLWGIPDGIITPTDVTFYLIIYSAGDLRADLTEASAPNPGSAGFGIPDGIVSPSDFSAFVAYYNAGCPCILPNCN